MIRVRMCLAILLCQPFPTYAQSQQWKAIACTIENSEVMRGDFFTVYFTDDGQVSFEGSQYRATVNNAEIDFCTSLNCYTISRISGRFRSSSTDQSRGKFGHMNGTCLLQAQQPKF